MVGVMIDGVASMLTAEYWAALGEESRRMTERAQGRDFLARCTIRSQLLAGASDLALATGRAL